MSSAKQAVLTALEQHKGEAISGEQLATQIGISRTAVWKIVSGLKEQGYPILTLPGKGYTLAAESDHLSKAGILPYLSPKWQHLDIQVHESIDSTNSEAKRLAIDGAAHGTAVIADTQTAGKGRLGRSFHAPAGTGLYISTILRLDVAVTDAVLITTAASIAVCRAVRQCLPDLEPQIKWVNDVYLHGKKLCGILTEAVTNFESGTIDSVVVGIGINVCTKFESELADIATSLTTDPAAVHRTRLAAAVLENLLAVADDLSRRTFMEEYHSLSMTIGQDVTVITPIDSYPATVLDVDRNGGLVVRRADGTLTTLSSGEISIRKAL